MRVLHTSDWHLGRTLEGRQRLPEQEQFIDQLCDIASSEEVDMVFVADDVFDTSNPAAAAEELYFDALERLSDGGSRAVVVIAGNHDSPDRIRATNPLAAKHGISLIGYPGDDTLDSSVIPPVFLYDQLRIAQERKAVLESQKADT